jgi:hypothetical protein
LNTRNVLVAEIHRQLVQVYAEDAMSQHRNGMWNFKVQESVWRTTKGVTDPHEIELLITVRSRKMQSETTEGPR